MYLHVNNICLEVTKCKKCGKVIAEPKELIRIQSMEAS